MKFKGLCAAIMATVTALSMTIPTFAAEATNETTEQTRETVNIAGYDCWEEDGNYFAVVDGEVSLILDFTDISHLSKCADIASVNAVSTNAVSPNAMSGKYYDVNLSNGEEYQGRIDITNGDCSTPIFFRAAASDGCPYGKFKFKTGYILPEKYSMTVYLDYADFDGYPYLHWTKVYDVTISFNLLQQSYCPIILAYQSDYRSICQIEFHKEGSTGDQQFNYWMSAVVI